MRIAVLRSRPHASGRENAGSPERHDRCIGHDAEEPLMNLVVWLPVMFALGLASMGLCLAFVAACDRI
jgi:hypothetical protein